MKRRTIGCLKGCDRAHDRVCWVCDRSRGKVYDRAHGKTGSYLGTLSKYTAVLGLCRQTVASTPVMRLIAAADVMPVVLLGGGGGVVVVVMAVAIVAVGVVGVAVAVAECLCVVKTACVASTHILTSTWL